MLGQPPWHNADNPFHGRSLQRAPVLFGRRVRTSRQEGGAWRRSSQCAMPRPSWIHEPCRHWPRSLGHKRKREPSR